MTSEREAEWTKRLALYETSDWAKSDYGVLIRSDNQQQAEALLNALVVTGEPTINAQSSSLADALMLLHEMAWKADRPNPGDFSAWQVRAQTLLALHQAQIESRLEPKAQQVVERKE